MATWASTQSGLWSRASNNADSPWYDGGTQTGWATVPADGDTVTIADNHSVCCDVDQSAFANGLANVVITGDTDGNGTPGMLYANTASSTVNWLTIKTGGTLSGTTVNGVRGRLVANAEGTWAGTTDLDVSTKFVISLKGTAYMDASNLDQNLRRAIPTYHFVETYGTKITVASVSAANDTLTIDDGAGVFVNGTAVKLRSSGDLPGGIDGNTVYYTYNRTLVGGTTYTVQLYYLATTAYGLVDITDVGSGTIEIYTGHSNLATGTMNVLTDVTSYANWSTAANFNAVLLESLNPSASPYYDVQRTTLSNIAAGTITLAANVDSVQTPGALICLQSSNVQILTNSTSTGHYMMDWKTSTFTGSVVNACFRNTAGNPTTMTVYSRGTNAGVGHTINSMFANCYYGVTGGSGHSGTWYNTGCYYGVTGGSGHSGTWYNTGCYYGVNAGSGHSGTWYNTGCTYGVNAGSGHSGTWYNTGCTNGVYTGSGHSGTWYNTRCAYGVYLGSYGYVTLTSVNCTYDLRSVDNIALNNSTFGATENYQYLYPYRADNSYNQSSNHNVVSGAEKDWCNGGYVTSETTSPPTGYTRYYRHTGELPDHPTFRRYQVTVEAGQTLIVSGLIRNTDGVDLSSMPPRLEIVDVYNDTLIVPGATVLAVDELPVADGSNTAWQDVAVSWTNPDAAPRLVYVRVISYTDAGVVDECLYSPDTAAQVSVIYTKLPSKGYLTGTDNASGDIEMDDATGNYPGSVGSVAGAITVTTNNDKTGYALTGDYDAAKSAAQAGDEMDLVDAPNTTAVTAIQSGLATGSDVSTAESNIRGADSDTLKTISDEIDAVPTAEENRTEMDSNSTKLATISTAATDTNKRVKRFGLGSE